jgi:hypothetical protein
VYHETNRNLSFRRYKDKIESAKTYREANKILLPARCCLSLTNEDIEILQTMACQKQHEQKSVKKL